MGSGWQTSPMNSAIVESGRTVNPLTPRQLPYYCTPDQVARLLTAMPASQSWLFALVLWRTALRQAEALKLEGGI